MGPHILTQLEGIYKEINIFFLFDFLMKAVCLPFTASVRWRKPGATLVPSSLVQAASVDVKLA